MTQSTPFSLQIPGETNSSAELSFSTMYSLGISVNGETHPSTLPTFVQVNYAQRYWIIRVFQQKDMIYQLLVDFDQITSVNIEPLRTKRIPLEILTLECSNFQVYEGSLEIANEILAATNKSDDNEDFESKSRSASTQKIQNSNQANGIADSNLRKNTNKRNSKRFQQRISIVLCESALKRPLMYIQSYLPVTFRHRLAISPTSKRQKTNLEHNKKSQAAPISFPLPIPPTLCNLSERCINFVQFECSKNFFILLFILLFFFFIL